MLVFVVYCFYFLGWITTYSMYRTGVGESVQFSFSIARFKEDELEEKKETEAFKISS